MSTRRLAHVSFIYQCPVLETHHSSVHMRRDQLSTYARIVLGTSHELFMHPLPWVCLENTTLGWKEPIAKERLYKMKFKGCLTTCKQIHCEGSRNRWLGRGLIWGVLRSGGTFWGAAMLSIFTGGVLRMGMCIVHYSSNCAVFSCSVTSDSLQPHGLSPCQAPLSVEMLQARMLERVTRPSPRGFSQPRNRTGVSCIAGRLVTS